ncbi:MAG: MFS transporter, partial [Nocardia sp.]|nr:MFS transporter [Nocardia sp.]
MSAQDPDQRFRAEIAAARTPAQAAPERGLPPGFTDRDLLELFEAQVLSRQADLAARRLGASGRGFYSIGSSGHEGNAAVSAATRISDPV